MFYSKARLPCLQGNAPICSLPIISHQVTKLLTSIWLTEFIISNNKSVAAIVATFREFTKCSCCHYLLPFIKMHHFIVRNLMTTEMQMMQCMNLMRRTCLERRSFLIMLDQTGLALVVVEKVEVEDDIQGDCVK